MVLQPVIFIFSCKLEIVMIRLASISVNMFPLHYRNKNPCLAMPCNARVLTRTEEALLLG